MQDSRYKVWNKKSEASKVQCLFLLIEKHKELSSDLLLKLQDKSYTSSTFGVSTNVEDGGLFVEIIEIGSDGSLRDKGGKLRYQSPELFDLNFQGKRFAINNQITKNNIPRFISWVNNDYSDSLHKAEYLNALSREFDFKNNTIDANNIICQNKNQILYGPPGTGKTFNTRSLALEIVSPTLSVSDMDHEDICESYHDKTSSSQIVFATFHQSMSYEDFVEGIKPNLDGGDVNYQVQEGIFKSIAKEAEENFQRSMNSIKSVDSTALKATHSS